MVTINWLFIFIPIAVALEQLRPEAHTWIFFAACLAIIPIATSHCRSDGAYRGADR